MISRNSETKFLPGHKEGGNLSLINSLSNTHLVQIVTSFIYRDKFNIVFRKATTNLEKAIRDPRYQLGQIVPPLRRCPIWPQMLGMAKALKDFSNGNWNQPSGDSNNDQNVEDIENARVSRANSVAIHFDLKPSNILVHRPSRNSPTFTFIITDFGLAHIRDTATGSSLTGDRGGDEAYAPPECMQEQQSRKYDIWSLGCIYLEILTFLVKGYEGVEELDRIRCAPPRRGRQNRCFWEQDAQSGPTLKEGVQNFVLELQNRADAPGQYSPEETRLIKNTIVMIMKMLCIQPEFRLTSSNVVWWLEQIGRGHEMLNDRAGSVSHDEVRMQAEPAPPPPGEPSRTATNRQIVSTPWWESTVRAGDDVQLAERSDMELEIEPTILRSLRNILVRSNIDSSKEDSNAVLQVFATESGTLRFVVTLLNLIGHEPLEQNCWRQHVHVMPQYAFRKHHNTRRNDAGLRLVWRDDLSKPIIKYDFSGKLNDLRQIHGAILGQEIYHTIEVENVTLVRPRHLFSHLRKGSKRDQTLSEKGPFTVQLWRDKPPVTVNDKSWRPRLCRLVVYLSTTVYVIPFHQYFRFPSQSDVLAESLTILKSGTVQDSKQTFEMTVLEASQPPDILPTFPLDANQLDDMLTKRPEPFKAVEIVFRAHEDLSYFWNDYRVLKEDWLDEMGIKRKVVPDAPPSLSLDFG